MARWRIDPEEQNRLVTVARFDSQSAFAVARSLLEFAGIECFSVNENAFRIAGPFHSYFGSFHLDLQVRESEADDARAILNEVPSESADDLS